MHTHIFLQAISPDILNFQMLFSLSYASLYKLSPDKTHGHSLFSWIIGLQNVQKCRFWSTALLGFTSCLRGIKAPICYLFHRIHGLLDCQKHLKWLHKGKKYNTLKLSMKLSFKLKVHTNSLSTRVASLKQGSFLLFNIIFIDFQKFKEQKKVTS